MIVHEVSGAPPENLTHALAKFEHQFHYPLGEGRSFRICHGSYYPRFFRAIGEARSFVAQQDGNVVGVISAALRKLRLPEGQEIVAAYFADLKIASSALRGRVLLRLFEAAKRWMAPEAQAAYAVVMDGTRITPGRYTGRFDIPRFEQLGKLVVLRLSGTGYESGGSGRLNDAHEHAESCFHSLTRGQCTLLGGDPYLRSQCEPQWLALADGSACGRIEDTLRAKRLIDSIGNEMLSAHLSSFAYRDAKSAASLLKEAIVRAKRRGLPALFVAVTASDVADILRLLPDVSIVTAPATIYGAGLLPGMNWNINTAEI